MRRSLVLLQMQCFSLPFVLLLSSMLWSAWYHQKVGIAELRIILLIGYFIEVTNSLLLLIVGGAGLLINIIGLAFFHG